MAKKKEKPAEQAASSAPVPVPRLLQKYKTEVLPALKSKLGRENPMSMPKVEKIVVNMGVGEAVTDKKFLEEAVAALTQIAGQKPLVTKSRHAIACFKLREHLPIGCKVTLRGWRMYEFLDRLVSLALPRVRDFRGLNPNAFDGRGNYSLGLQEQLVFPELNPDKFTRPQGMNVCIVTTSNNNDEARELLRGMGVPFKTEEPKGKKGAA
jgi:large subunit ribosomal protein L5